MKEKWKKNERKESRPTIKKHFMRCVETWSTIPTEKNVCFKPMKAVVASKQHEFTSNQQEEILESNAQLGSCCGSYSFTSLHRILYNPQPLFDPNNTFPPNPQTLEFAKSNWGRVLFLGVLTSDHQQVSYLELESFPLLE
ncbi:hypothetical protein L6452_04883 [Arctium lappa]|uniref:Uncharacterized protein n=1 Tax=Arctium lappa TaxID=4217 RepID=A0ACB9EFW6_ARCLA|nr:hypothetical protein L6452_04883 [Arctium lappa]